MEFRAPDVTLWAILPTVIVAVTAMVALLQGVLAPAGGPRRAVATSLTGLAAAAAATVLAVVFRAPSAFGGMLLLDRLAVLFYLTILVATAVAVLLVADHLAHDAIEASEAVALLNFCAVGMMLMASSGSLIMIFVGLETMSVALYILSGLTGARERASNEAALKYLLLGAFATGFLVYGMAFLYGATGSLDLVAIAGSIRGGQATPGFLNLGFALLLIGLGFKVALVPFHMWAPDVYEGAPTPISAFMSVGVKVAAFAAFIRIFDQAALDARDVWLPALWGLTAVTMVVANVVALAQTSLKRLLAYSSIAHAGYLAVGVIAGTAVGAQAILFNALSYTLMNLGAFVVLAALNHPEDRPTLDDLQGLGRRSPLLAGAMAVFMFALAGIPPLSGFLGKWLVFSAAVQAGQVPLAVLAVLCSAISAFYYLRVVVMMYMREPVAGAPEPRLAGRTRWALQACLVGTVLLSLPFGLAYVSVAGWGVG